MGGLLGARRQRVTGEPAFSHAVMPPVTLNQRSMPWRLSALITVLERRPPAQRTALGRSAGTSPTRRTASSIGRGPRPPQVPAPPPTRLRPSETPAAPP